MGQPIVICTYLEAWIIWHNYQWQARRGLLMIHIFPKSRCQLTPWIFRNLIVRPPISTNGQKLQAMPTYTQHSKESLRRQVLYEAVSKLRWMQQYCTVYVPHRSAAWAARSKQSTNEQRCGKVCRCREQISELRSPIRSDSNEQRSILHTRIYDIQAIIANDLHLKSARSYCSQESQNIR